MLLFLYLVFALLDLGASAPFRGTQSVPRSFEHIVANNTNSTLGASSRKNFLVKKLPDVNFTVPRSYAGEMPLANKPGNNLFFWYFETEKKGGSDDLIVW